ncbi:alpha/beta fold hydrolase, partial [Actinophytocola sp.]|uniref:alpha/beta fold hydrolase n=1 Tax=Actinophytocola sp. TaxID=1872138 RepID=UPI002D810233
RVRQVLAVLAAVVVVPLIAPGTAPAHPDRPDPRPVVFVHGFAGSGAQFQTQAKRLASNGYPAEIVETHEYDSTAISTILPQVWADLDARVSRLLERTGADRVDILGHSLGTFVMQGYLNSAPQRAARVAHYVNLDGASATAQPGGVPTLAVWGEGDPARTIAGATNVRFPDQSHTQVVTSPETFVEFYRFFTGHDPRTTRIVPTPPGHTMLSGRAVFFPTNAGVTGARLEVYQVTGLTGHRRHQRPDQVFALAGDGSFGPFRADGRARYEFAVVYPDGQAHHIYFQPFERTDRLIRLLTSRPGEGLSGLMDTSPRHTNLTVNRNKEWWGDQGEGSDLLLVDGRNILNAANAPRTKRAIGMFVFDRAADGVTDLTAPIPEFFSQPFITAMDVFLPTRLRVVTVLAVPRGTTGHVDNLTVPAWPSTGHRVSVGFNDYIR